jgi:hypothetical protein
LEAFERALRSASRRATSTAATATATSIDGIWFFLFFSFFLSLLRARQIERFPLRASS